MRPGWCLVILLETRPTAAESWVLACDVCGDALGYLLGGCALVIVAYLFAFFAAVL